MGPNPAGPQPGRWGFVIIDRPGSVALQQLSLQRTTIHGRLMVGPGRVGAQSGLGPCPGWGPYGPLWAHRALMGPILLKKSLILINNHKIINKNIKIVNLGILKVKTWFGDKDY